MFMSPILIFFLVVVLMVFAVFIGLALGNVFAKNKPVQKDDVCDFAKCNEELSNWVIQQKGDIDNSSKQFAGCKACPERSYSQLTNEVQKYKLWKEYKTPEDAIQAMVL
jgi:hypothetical protein